jgi:hypothetical protein
MSCTEILKENMRGENKEMYRNNIKDVEKRENNRNVHRYNIKHRI